MKLGLASSNAPGPDSSSDSESESDEVAPTSTKKAVDSSSDSSDDSDDASVAKAEKTTKAPSGDSSNDSSDNEQSDEDGDVAMKDGTANGVAPPASKRKAEPETVAPAKKAKLSSDGDVSSNPSSATIWIGNLSWNVDDDWLKTEFESYGELVSARVQTDRSSGRSRGFAYVEFKDIESAKAAVADTTKEIDGRSPRVDFAPPRSAPDQAKRARAFDDKVSDPSSILFVGNLSFDATEDA